MKQVTHNILATVVGMTFLMFPAHATEKNESGNEEQNLLVGMGTGALIGSAVAGPLGAAVGGVFGVLLGNEKNRDEANEQMTLTLAQYKQQIESAQTLARQQQYEYDSLVSQVREMEKHQSLVSYTEDKAVNFAPIELNIQFATGSNQIPKHYLQGLSDIAARLKTDEKLGVQLFGYADRTGDEKYNLRLSEQRAFAVKDYLVKQGMSERQIDVDGFGEAQPVAHTQSWQNDFYDRRVVVRIGYVDAIQTAAKD